MGSDPVLAWTTSASLLGATTLDLTLQPEQQWRLKWPLLSFCRPLFFFSLSHQLTSHLQLHKALGMPFISLITCVCQLHIYPNALSFTHAFALWGCGFQAAMTQSRFLLLIAKKCVLCRTISPQSPDFLALQLWSTWHRGLVSTVLCFSCKACQTPTVSLITLLGATV